MVYLAPQQASDSFTMLNEAGFKFIVAQEDQDNPKDSPSDPKPNP